MELQAAQPAVRMAPKHPTAPPPPLRRKLHVPAEPLLFACVLMALVMFIAKAMPTGAAEESSSAAPATVAHQTTR